MPNVYRKTAMAAAAVLWILLINAGQSATLRVAVPGQKAAQVDTQKMRIAARQDGRIHAVTEDSFYKSQPGEPDIPWRVVSVLLPPNADLDSVSIHLENVEYNLLEGSWNIEPAPPIGTWDPQGNPVLLWPEDRVIEDGYDKSVYETDAFWPAGPRLVHSGRLDHWQVAEVAVPLAQYNPVTGQVRELTRADVIVDSPRHGRGKADPKDPARGGINARRGRSRIRDLAINFSSAAGEYDTASEETVESENNLSASTEEGQIGTASINSEGYVIITTNSIVSGSSQLADFVANKEAHGWNVTVVTEDIWGGGTGSTGAVNIRNWLRANYVSMDILYVLLIGNPHPDTGNVPMRWYDDGRGSAPTDAMYSDLSTADGWDKYWEVIVGRIPSYGTMSILDAILLKTINYENSQTVLWRRNGLLPMVPLDDTTPAYQCGEQIRDQFYTPNGITSTRIYRSDYGLVPAPEYLLASRYPATEWGSQPYGFVAWLTHGNQTLASEVIDTDNTWRLNDSYPSAVYQGSCQNAWPENSANLAFRILQRGAITAVGATRDSFYDVGQTNFAGGGSIGTLAYRYSRNMAAYRQTCGVALCNAKQQDYIYPPNATRMTLLGDPSILVMVDPDFVAPTPNPMTWAAEPNESGPGAVTMTATTAEDNGGTGVQYYFQCVSGGGRDSGWQGSPVYTDTSVVQLVNSYRVKARDLSDHKNETAYSTEAFVTIEPYPYENQLRTIPGKIQAQYFDVGGQDVTYYDTTVGNSGSQLRTREDVDIVAVTDGSANYAIDNIETGEWLLYTVNSSAVVTSLYARVASTQAGNQIHVWLDDQLLGTINVPNTGSLTVWQNAVITGLTLPEREKASLRLEFVGSGFRLNWIAFQNQSPYLGNPFVLPGHIEFEDFDIGGQDISYYDTTLTNTYGSYRPSEDVDIMAITGGYGVYMSANDWMEYTCSNEPGFYTLVIRHTSNQLAQTLTLSDEEGTLATVTLPKTSGWSNWQDTTVSNVYLPGGQERVLRFKMTASIGLLDYVDFIREYNTADINQQGLVDMEDFLILSSQWQGEPNEPSADIAPEPADNWVDLLDLITLSENWLGY
jgi:hypothetical protein